MKDNPNAHEFDWVTARQQCSLDVGFNNLRAAVEDNCLTRTGYVSGGRPYIYKFCLISTDEFQAIKFRENTPIRFISFCRKHDHIAVEESGANEWSMSLTLTLNDEGLCRFKIDDEGEYLRWQVIRRALSPLFFDEPRPEK